MVDESTSYYVPGQTDPDIFAGRLLAAPGQAGDGRFYQWTIGVTLGGICRYRTANRSFNVAAGDVVIARPHCRSSWRAGMPDTAAGERAVNRADCSDAWNVVYAAFHPRSHWYRWLDAFDYDAGLLVMHFDESPFEEVQSILLSVVDVYMRGGLLRDERTLATLELAVIAIYSGTARLQIAPDERIRKAVEYIQTHFTQPVGLADIAQASGLSIPHLSSLFANALGASPVKYLERVRMSHAAEMLRFSEAPVGQVAQAAGYGEPTYFSHRFHLQFGQTPTEYRAASRPGRGTDCLAKQR